MRTGLRRTGQVVTAGLVLLGPVAVALAASGTFTGTTSQGDVCGSHFKSPCRVRVEVNNQFVGKKKTGESHIYWRAACKRKTFLTGNTEFWGQLKNRSLTVPFNYNETASGPSGSVTAHNTGSITVHVGKKVTGTLTDSSVVHHGGHVINHCHTGTVTFTARR
jgi:hypothetical protein